MKRSKFSLSHYKLLTCDMGELIPLTWFEALPGDSIQHATSMLLRVSPLLAPVMHPVRVRIHHWFVPNRLIWDDWEDFITGGPDGTSVPEHPYKDTTSPAAGSLYDYFGLCPGTYSPAIKVSALPFRAYAMIWNNFYRDQDLEAEITISTAEGDDNTTSSLIRNVSWEKDYFTTCRPWEQKGTEISIPLTGDAPITGIGKQTQTYDTGPFNVYETDGSGTTAYAKSKVASNNSTNEYFHFEEDPNNAGFPNIRADLSAVSGVDINDLRVALALQRYQEARARYGSRYVEYLRYLGVNSKDQRHNLPEYLGGGRQVIQFSEVLQTAEGTDPVADMKGHGIAAVRSNRYRKFFDEHGIVMSLMSVIPKTIYAQGLQRAFIRETKEDYFQKELQHIGSQEVYNKEVYVDAADPDDVFGYQSRYDDYRTVPSGIAGEFRDTLDHWHYARLFASEPALNSTFVSAVPTKRVNASTDTDCLYIMANHSVQARRLLSPISKPMTF